jgi:hypothetical protein
MTTTDLATATGYKATMDKISAIDALIALIGSKGFVAVTDAAGKEIVSGSSIVAAIGQTAYDTLCSNALDALDTALTSANTAASNALTAL